MSVEGAVHISNSGFGDKLDFLGISASDIEIADSKFRHDVNLTGIKSGRILISDTEFEQSFDLAHSQIGGNVTVEGSTFRDNAIFDGTTVDGSLLLQGNEFTELVSMDLISVAQTVQFFLSSFSKDLFFRHSEVNGNFVLSTETAAPTFGPEGSLDLNGSKVKRFTLEEPMSGKAWCRGFASNDCNPVPINLRGFEFGSLSHFAAFLHPKLIPFLCSIG